LAINNWQQAICKLAFGKGQLTSNTLRDTFENLVCLLLIVYCLLPIAHCLLVTTFGCLKNNLMTTKKITAAITAVVDFVPEDKLTNADLEKMFETTDEWIKTRTGISECRILKGEGKASSDMGAPAVIDLCHRRGIDPL